MNPLSPNKLEELTRTRLAVDLDTAGCAWGIGRTKVHELARAGALPLDVVRIGTSYRVPVSAILHCVCMTPNSSKVEPAVGTAAANTVAAVEMQVFTNSTGTVTFAGGAA